MTNRIRSKVKKLSIVVLGCLLLLSVTAGDILAQKESNPKILKQPNLQRLLALDECPKGCKCLNLTVEEGRKRNLDWCQQRCKLPSGEIGNCFSGETLPDCAPGCACLDIHPNQKPEGLIFCKSECNLPTGKIGYCWKRAPPECPSGCSCLDIPPEQAPSYLEICQENPRCDGGYCYRNLSPTCPSDCQCRQFPPNEAPSNLELCEENPRCLLRIGVETQAATHATPTYGYCYRAKSPGCPADCECLNLSRDEGTNRNLTWCEQRCQLPTGETGNCFKGEPVPDCPNGCTCLDLHPQEDPEGLEFCDSRCQLPSGKIAYCWRRAPPEECPDDCNCLDISPNQAPDHLKLCTEQPECPGGFCYRREVPKPEEIFYSTEEDFITQGPEPADGNPIISDGDLLHSSGFVYMRNRELLQLFHPRGELGLDAAEVIDVESRFVAFSTDLDGPMGSFTAGDILATNGAIIPNSALLWSFGVRDDLGLDALFFQGNNDRVAEFLNLARQKGREYWSQNPSNLSAHLQELGIDIWFSTEAGFFERGSPVFLDGDLLSAANGAVVLSNKDALPSSVPAGLPQKGVDFGMDAMTKLGEKANEAQKIVFSTEINGLEFSTKFTEGDALVKGNGVSLTNWDLIRPLEPKTKDVGLDALSPPRKTRSPMEPPECPLGCSCLDIHPEENPEGLDFCNSRCHIATGEVGYCWRKTPAERCPVDCKCLDISPNEAPDHLELCAEHPRCLLTATTEPTTATHLETRTGYCYRDKTTNCPRDCMCLGISPENASDDLEVCEEKPNCVLNTGEEGHCYRKRAPECPPGCHCLTFSPDEAPPNLTLCEESPRCQTGKQRENGYCYRKDESGCPGDCTCLDIPPALALPQFELCLEDPCCELPSRECECGYCYRRVATGCPDCCICMTESEISELVTDPAYIERCDPPKCNSRVREISACQCDGFSGADSPTDPSSILLQWVQRHYKEVDFKECDDMNRDRYWAHTFSNLKVPGCQIVSGLLKITVANGQQDDYLQVGVVNDPNAPWPSSGINSRLNWSGFVTVPDFGSNVGIPEGRRGTIAVLLRPLVDEINAGGHLDVVVGDDSAVDCVTLFLVDMCDNSYCWKLKIK